jgi:hypothetical protein
MRKILERAKDGDLSLAKTVITLLEERLGLGSDTSDRTYHDLDHLAGSWTKEECDAFDSALSEGRLIDAEGWE